MSLTQLTVDVALMSFQLRAQAIATEYAVPDIKTSAAAGYLHGPVYYCCYRLPTSPEWDESPEGETIALALLNLRTALAQRAGQDFFSGN